MRTSRFWGALCAAGLFGLTIGLSHVGNANLSIPAGGNLLGPTTTGAPSSPAPPAVEHKNGTGANPTVTLTRAVTVVLSQAPVATSTEAPSAPTVVRTTATPKTVTPKPVAPAVAPKPVPPKPVPPTVNPTPEPPQPEPPTDGDPTIDPCTVVVTVHPGGDLIGVSSGEPGADLCAPIGNEYQDDHGDESCDHSGDQTDDHSHDGYGAPDGSSPGGGEAEPTDVNAPIPAPGVGSVSNTADQLVGSTPVGSPEGR